MSELWSILVYAAENFWKWPAAWFLGWLFLVPVSDGKTGFSGLRLMSGSFVDGVSEDVEKPPAFLAFVLYLIGVVLLVAGVSQLLVLVFEGGLRFWIVFGVLLAIIFGLLLAYGHRILNKVFVSLERQGCEHEKKLNEARSYVRLVCEKEKDGQFRPSEMKREAQENGWHYLARADEIERQLANSGSPLFSEGSCFRLACFVKRHATDMAEVEQYGSQQLGDLFFRYHRYEREILKEAIQASRMPPEPEREEPAEKSPYEVAKEKVDALIGIRTGTFDGIEDGKDAIRSKGENRKKQVLADESLSEDEKTERLASIARWIEKEIKGLDRKEGRI